MHQGDIIVVLWSERDFVKHFASIWNFKPGNIQNISKSTDSCGKITAELKLTTPKMLEWPPSITNNCFWFSKLFLTCLCTASKTLIRINLTHVNHSLGLWQCQPDRVAVWYFHLIRSRRQHRSSGSGVRLQCHRDIAGVYWGRCPI